MQYWFIFYVYQYQLVLFSNYINFLKLSSSLPTELFLFAPLHFTESFIQILGFVVVCFCFGFFSWSSLQKSSFGQKEYVGLKMYTCYLILHSWCSSLVAWNLISRRKGIGTLFSKTLQSIPDVSNAAYFPCYFLWAWLGAAGSVV